MSVYKTKELVHNRALEIEGMPFRNIDKTNRLDTGKGGVGNMIEENWFDLVPDNIPLPDFIEAGVELKVTPFIRIKKTKGVPFSAKERLVLNIIDYMEEYKKDFEESSFWLKNKILEILFYEHDSSRDKLDWYIYKAIQFTFPKKDLEIIKADRDKIISYINQGRADELSEGLTDILGACTKGATSKSVRSQPFSDKPAKQRAFSLKQGYMTSILRTFIMGDSQDEAIIKDAFELVETTFEDIIINKVSPFISLKRDTLKSKLGVSSSYRINASLVARMLDVNGDLNSTDEFRKSSIQLKTMTLNRKGYPKEDMSFPTFKFKELIEENWEESTVREFFMSTRFLFAVFQEKEKGNPEFLGIKFWNMPISDIDGDLQKVWHNTINIIVDGVILEEKKGKTHNNLPKASENPVSHVRPHKSKASYIPYNPNADQLPDGRWMTAQCFWLNKPYILKQVENLLI